MIRCKLENINTLERGLIMRYAQLREMDITDGTGIRVSLYTSGCPYHCNGCFQPETWSYKGGKEYTQETEDKIISLCGRSYIKGLSLLGGEPLSIQNYKPLLHLVQRFKEEYPDNFTLQKAFIKGAIKTYKNLKK